MKNLENNENAIKKYYEDFKKDNPNVIMLFRDNDFYDVYEDDIKEVKEVIKLCTQKKRKNGMKYLCFPRPALDIYLPRLVRCGKRVAIVEYPIYKK